MLRELTVRRADPDPDNDQWEFDIAWSGEAKSTRESANFQDGQLLHQINIAKSLQFQYDARSKALDAVAKEREGYLNTFVLLVAAIGLVAQDQVRNILGSMHALAIWIPAIVIIMLLRSHSSKLSSLGDNYEGAGARSGRVKSNYLLVNELRKALLQRNAELQRAKRSLAMVSMAYQLSIFGACMYLTVARLFG